MRVPSGLRPRALVRAAVVAGVMASVAVGVTGSASASSDGHPWRDRCGPDWEFGRAHVGAGVPDSKISIQLFNFVGYIVGDFTNPNSLEVMRARIDEILRRLHEIGYRNVELFSFAFTPGQTFTLGGYDAEQLKALLDSYHLNAQAGHASMDEATFDVTLAGAKTLGQRFVGSGGWAAPGIGSYEDVLATAAAMNRLGKRSVRNGTGKVYGHNHQQEFRTKYTDPRTGQLKTAWQILVENTDRRYVAIELDVLWATDGGEDPARLIRRYGDRIDLLHIKDGINVADPANATPVSPGEGEIDFKPILRAARGQIDQYIFEQDPPLFPPDPTFDPFSKAEKGYEFLDCVRF